jgi:hypothetical protein
MYHISVLGSPRCFAAFGRMNLQRELLAGIEDLAEQRKATLFSGPGAAHHLAETLLHQIAQRPAGEWTVGDDAFVAETIRDLPGLADGYIGGSGFPYSVSSVRPPQTRSLKRGWKISGYRGTLAIGRGRT